MKLTKTQRQKISDEISNGKFISVIVPSVNKRCAKRLVLSSEMYQMLKIEADKRLEDNNYCLLMDSNYFGDLLNTGHLRITKQQFDKILKDNYNLTYATTRNGKELKKIE